LKAVKRVSQQKISFTACKSSFTRPVKPTGSPPLYHLHPFKCLKESYSQDILKKGKKAQTSLEINKE
jgi:hypothetical protein